MEGILIKHHLDKIYNLLANKEKVRHLNLKGTQVLSKKMGSHKIISMRQNQLQKFLQHTQIWKPKELSVLDHLVS